MANKGKVTALDATPNQKGVSIIQTRGICLNSTTQYSNKYPSKIQQSQVCISPNKDGLLSFEEGDNIELTAIQNGMKISSTGSGTAGISTINKLSGDSSGNFTIIGDDQTGIKVAEASYPRGVLEVSANEAGIYQRGTIKTSSENNTQEGSDSQTAVTPRSLGSKLGSQTKGKFAQGADYGYPIKWVDLPPPPPPSYVPIPFDTFITDKVANTNFAYSAIDSKTILTLQLPPRGSFKRGDIIEVDNLSAAGFKITLNKDIILRYNDITIQDIDKKFLISKGPGSSIKLRAESGQLWYVVRHNQVSVSSANLNGPKNVLPINMYLKRNATESFTFDGTGAEYHIRPPKFAQVGEINDITFTNKGIAQLAQRPHWAAQGENDDYYVSPQMTVKIGDMQSTRGHNGVVYIKGPAHIKLKCTRRHLINPESIQFGNIQYWEMDFEALEWSGDISVK